MAFAAERDGHRLYRAPLTSAAPDTPLPRLTGDEIGVTLSPVTLVPGVLGRLARTLAAAAHFSLDRFSDVYLVTDTLAAYAQQAAAGGRIVACMSSGERRLELRLGPFRPGTGAALTAAGPERASSPLALLADEIEIRETAAGELVEVVVVDHRQ
jgi:hypothetical protein